MIKRIDPKQPRIPLKNFKPETRPLDKNPDPKLLELMKKYQKRGIDMVDQIAKAQEIKIEKELKKLQAEEQENLEATFAELRKDLPEDIIQRIVSGEKFDDTSLDSAPKRKVLTREEALRRISDKNK